MKRWLKLVILIIVILICVGGLSLGIFLSTTYIKAASLKLDDDVLTSRSLMIPLFDNENKPIKEENLVNGSYIKKSALPSYTIDAFISIEDKDFYKHNGVNYKRIVKAMLNNIKSGKLKEGASTISQQLIKNTHLSSEKTFERKFKEIALAKKLEKKYSKDEIMEMYLNAVYFGNNCYGIQSASNYYFSIDASELSLEQSALLAGLLKSPNRYSPVSHKQKCLERRNLVLSEMQKDGKITPSTYILAKDKPIELKLNSSKKNRLNSYSQASIDEATSILKMPAKQIALNGYKIYTYLDKSRQESLEKAIESASLVDDHAGIVIDNQKCGIVSFSGDSVYKVLEAKRQPGSCIKPVLVYGPALNEDIIYPCTQLLDEKTTIAGYSPKNVGEKYRGYVSARQALSQSINIPAVKVLSYVGIDKAKRYASNLGIEFDEKDDSFALALGGMNYGTNLASLAGAYTTFANGGVYSTPRFISFITDKNNKIIYVHHPEKKVVMREDASYLLTDMLCTCAKEGTAKKLNELGVSLASKTGTVGAAKSKDNLDAWNITYSQKQTVGVWIGNLDNTPIKVAGGNEPTTIVKNYFQLEKDDSTFKVPSCITYENIDSIELKENHRVVRANTYSPEIYCQRELFSRFNLPSDCSRRFVDIAPIKVKSEVQGDKAVLTLDALEYMVYEVYDEKESSKKKLAVIEGKSGPQRLEFEMDKPRQKYIIKSFYKSAPSRENKREINLIKSTQKSYI